MTHVADHFIAGPLRRRSRTVRHSAAPATPTLHCRDERWPALAAALAALRATRRCSVRIVDADCGAGKMLLCAVRYARALGFTAIEARGIDKAPALVDRARTAAAVVHDPAIGITFETGDVVGALETESEFPADIVVWHGCRARDAAIAQAVAAAGQTLIADPVGTAKIAA